MVVARLQSELSRAQAEAAESHQANLTLGAEMTVLERKQKNQVGLCWLGGWGFGGECNVSVCVWVEKEPAGGARLTPLEVAA